MTVCVDTVPIYGTFPLDDPSAWNGGARSVVSYTGNCWYGWDVGSVVGVACGLNGSDNVSTTYTDIDYGFVVLAGTYYPVQAGNVVSVVSGGHSPGQRYYIYRIDNKVAFCVRPSNADPANQYFDYRFPGYALPGYVAYVSPQLSYGNVFLDSALFALDDAVENEATGRTWTGFLNESQIPNPNTPIPVAPTNPGVGTSAVLAAGSGIIPLSITMTGTDNVQTPITSLIDGELTFALVSTSRSPVYLNGELEFALGAFGGDVPVTAGSIYGELEFTGAAVGTAPLRNGVRGYMEITGSASGELYEQTGVNGELPITLKMTGTDNVQTPITSFIDGEMELYGVGYATEVVNNYFNVAITFDVQPLLQELEVEITELFYALTAPLEVRYTNKVSDAIQIGTVVQSFYNPVVSLTEQALALANHELQFVTQIAEQFNISESIPVTQVVAIAEALAAAGTVQTIYQGIVAVLSALTVTDSKISGGGGSSGGGGGGIIIIDPTGTSTDTGTSGDPATIELVGDFPAGSTIEIIYETDTGGESTVVTTITSDTDAEGAATLLAADLDAQSDITAVTAV